MSEDKKQRIGTIYPTSLKSKVIARTKHSVNNTEGHELEHQERDALVWELRKEIGQLRQQLAWLQEQAADMFARTRQTASS